MISDCERYIWYVSPIYKGNWHDYKILKKEFPIDQNWFEDKEVKLDLGFQGFLTDYKFDKASIPHKRKRAKKGQSNELTDEQKAYNKEVGKQRIHVEHSIGGMKRYRILCHRNRLKNVEQINQIVGICAGLWNFKLSKIVNN